MSCSFGLVTSLQRRQCQIVAWVAENKVMLMYFRVEFIRAGSRSRSERVWSFTAGSQPLSGFVAGGCLDDNRQTRSPGRGTTPAMVIAPDNGGAGGELLAVLGGGVLGLRHRQLFGMNDGLVGGGAGGAEIGKFRFRPFALQHIGRRHRLAAFLVGDRALDDRPVNAPAAAVFGLVGNILETTVDHRFERVELLLDPPRPGIAAPAALAVSGTARASAARTAIDAIATRGAARVAITRPPARSAILRLADGLRLRVVRSFLAGAAVASAITWRSVALARCPFSRLPAARRRSVASAWGRPPAPASSWKLAFDARCDSPGFGCRRLAIGRRDLGRASLETRWPRQLAPAAHRPSQMKRRALRAPFGVAFRRRGVAAGIKSHWGFGRPQGRSQSPGGRWPQSAGRRPAPAAVTAGRAIAGRTRTRRRPRLWRAANWRRAKLIVAARRVAIGRVGARAAVARCRILRRLA